MRASCNGCRILRKACPEDCCVRPCLQWMKCPESQANATLFLAKFYGRAGLINLINAAAERHRPAVFRSLLYEACGRVVNPTYGSVGLLWSGNWQLCQRAVEAVLKGSPIVQMTTETAAGVPLQSLGAFDVRHVFKNDTDVVVDLHKVARASHSQFKHASAAASGTNPRWGQFYVSPSRVSEENESMLTAEESLQSTEEDGFGDGVVNVKLELSLCL